MAGKQRSDDVLVYSTHPTPPTKSQPQAANVSLPNSLGQWRSRVERKGRGGKTVTVIYRLPKHETLLDSLCKQLKKRFGCGGTFFTNPEEGVIELQGDRSNGLSEIMKGLSLKLS